MKHRLLVALMLILVVSLTACIWPFVGTPEVPSAPSAASADSQADRPFDYVGAAKQMLVWGMGIIGLAGLALAAVGFILEKKMALSAAVICGAGVLVIIGLLTYWQVFAAVVLVVALAAVAVGLLLAVFRVKQRLARSDKDLRSVVAGAKLGMERLAATSNDGAIATSNAGVIEIMKAALKSKQDEDGTREDVRAILHEGE